MNASLANYLLSAKKEGWAVPHFNFCTLAQLNGICDALREMKTPALLGTSEGERTFVGMRQARYLIESFREEGLAVYLNADHCKSLEAAKEAVDAGYDSVHIDLSKESYEKNIKETKELVEYAKAKNPDIHIEGELGYLATDSSKIYEKEIQIPEESYTNPEQAKEFVAETGIDRLAGAVGTIHGIAKNKPKLRFELIESLRSNLPDDVTLVLHGGSGVSDEELQQAARAGCNNIHVSTELRVAYTNALREEFKANPEEVTPYKYLVPPREATAELVRFKIGLFGAEGKCA